MATTDEYWDINGVCLAEYGWNCTTIGGPRYDVPPLRGENIQHAYVPGKEFRAKIPDSRVISLAMWLTGVVPTTGAAPADQIRQWNDNWAYLRHLLWTPDDELTLTRRWRLTDGEGDPYVQVVSAAAQLANTLEPTMTGRTRAEFVADFLLADPFFYGTEVEVEFAVGQTVVVNNPGDFLAAHKHFTVELTGDLVNPSLTNTTAVPDVSFTLNCPVNDPHVVTIDVARFAATDSAIDSSISISSVNRVAYLTHSGARQWMGLLRGDNSLTFDADSGDGTAVLRFRPPYI